MVLSFLNRIIKKSKWFYSYFPHCREYDRICGDCDFICIGSSPAKYAIDFSKEVVKGANLAVVPETISYDYRILRNYHTCLRKDGYVLFVLCPFTFLKHKYTKEDNNNFYLNIRYYPILPKSEIESVNERLYQMWNNPVSMGLKVWAGIGRFSLRRNRGIERVLDATEFDRDSEQRIRLWKNEFNLSDLAPSHINKDIIAAIQTNIETFKQIKDFNEKNNHKSIIIIPPFSDNLTKLIPEKFVEYALLKPIGEIGIPFISYYGQSDWMKNEFYLNSFLLNKKGRYALTHDIVKRLNVINHK